MSCIRTHIHVGTVYVYVHGAPCVCAGGCRLPSARADVHAVQGQETHRGAHELRVLQAPGMGECFGCKEQQTIERTWKGMEMQRTAKRSKVHGSPALGISGWLVGEPKEPIEPLSGNRHGFQTQQTTPSYRLACAAAAGVAAAATRAGHPS